MLKFKNQRKLAALGLVFALMLIAGTVYAALSGTLTFDGTVILSGGDVELTIEYYPEESSVSGYGDIELISNDGQTATFTVTLKEPGEYAYVPFDIRNTGSLDAEITAVNLSGGVTAVDPTGNDPDAVILTESFPSLGTQDALIDVGDYKTYYFEIEWDEDYSSETGEYTFTVTLDYEQA